MAEPAAKKARTEESGAAEEAEAEAAKELESDAKADKGARIKDTVTFRTPDTTINVMPGACASVLMPLTDGGMQYLLGGARSSVGVKAGRYMFEAKIVEVMNPADDPASRQRTPMPRSQLRIGFSLAKSSLFLGDNEDSIGFDTEGVMLYNKVKTSCSKKFGSDVVVAVVLNLDPSSPNANTVSLFKDGVRACPPQPLPERLRGKALFPTLTFKNAAVHYNFGPTPLVPLPFKCRMIQDATTKEATVTPAPSVPKDGKYEVLFPICLPDEGTFDWLDMFLEKNPEYTELSDRAIHAWAEKSGCSKPKGFSIRTSNDKPEMGFGLSLLDDGSIRRVLQAIAPVQQRPFVVMEVKSNLVKPERQDLVAKWPSYGFKRVAAVMIAEPPQVFKRRSQELALKAKQDAANAEFKAKQEEVKKKKALEKRQKQLEKERAKALAKQQRVQEQMKRKLEVEKKKAEAAAAGETYNEDEDEAMKAAKEAEEAEEAKAEEEEPEEEEPADSAMDEDPPKVELTNEEKRELFRKQPIPDLSSWAMSTTFTKFSVPDKEDGFDEIRFDWAQQQKCKDYMRQWVQERKTTTRIEDLKPGEWFTTRWKDWQKTLQSWHAKQNQYKASVAKQNQEKAAKDLAAAARKNAVAAAIPKASAEAPAGEKKDGDANGGESSPRAGGGDEATPGADEGEKVDFDKIDVFGVEDVLNVGGGEPLFSAFGFEDWTMMSLRFELHILAHAFRCDVNDQDRMGIHVEHLAFYYNKYFKKALNHKFYGVDTMQELLELVKDTVVVGRKGKVVEAQLPDDMESLGIFVMLTDEARRDRVRRVDMGDDTAKLKLSQPHVPQVSSAPAVVRPALSVAASKAGTALMGQVRPPVPVGAAGVGAAAGAWSPQVRPPLQVPQVRGFPVAPGATTAGGWRPQAGWRG